MSALIPLSHLTPVPTPSREPRGPLPSRLVDRFGRGVAVHVAVPEGLVELVEAGRGTSPAAEALLRPILLDWRQRGVDVIVLGCTHYPFARAAVERLAGPGVTVIDPAPAVARQAARVLASTGAPAPGTSTGTQPGSLTLLTTGSPARLQEMVACLTPPGWAAGAHFGPLSVVSSQ